MWRYSKPQVYGVAWVSVLVSLLKVCGLILLFLSVTACSPGLSGVEQAQSRISGDRIIFTNAQIHTLNETQPEAEAIAIQDGKIIAVGDEDAVLEQVGDDFQTIDLKGRMVMPGFQDPHLHAVESGLNENLCIVSQFADIEDYLDELQDCALQQPDSEWVRASGVNMPNLLDQDQLPIDILDEAIPDRPVVVLDDIGHGAWVNSRAMEAVGFSPESTDPPGGILVRDPETEELTGVVLENAQQVFRTASLPPTPDNLELAYQSLLRGIKTLNQNGITSVSDAGGFWLRGHPQVWKRAEEEGALSVRASNALYVFPDLPFSDQVVQLKALRYDQPDQLLRFNQVKIYVDGILSQGTGALLESYSEDYGIPGVPPDGFLYFDPPTLKKYATELAKAGFQLHFHVAGDRATHLALDAIDLALDVSDDPDPRHRITHLYLIDPADRPRFSELGAIADFQLAPSSLEDDYIESLEPYLGDRVDQLLPFFELLDEGANVVLSSDWDADELSPFEKIATVMLEDEEEVLDLTEILQMMTIDVAYLLHQDQTTGTLEVGKWADLIVLNQNIYEQDLDAIAETKVLMTMLAGDPVYQDESFSGN